MARFVEIDGRGYDGRLGGLSLLTRPGGDARAGNHRQNEAEQYKSGQGYRYEHWILDSVVFTKTLWVCVSYGNTITGVVGGVGCSQHTRYRRPHVRHSYWPCEGHKISVCINRHHRSAIWAWGVLIDSYA